MEELNSSLNGRCSNQEAAAAVRQKLGRSCVQGGHVVRHPIQSRVAASRLARKFEPKYIGKTPARLCRQTSSHFGHQQVCLWSIYGTLTFSKVTQLPVSHGLISAPVCVGRVVKARFTRCILGQNTVGLTPIAASKILLLKQLATSNEVYGKFAAGFCVQRTYSRSGLHATLKVLHAFWRECHAVLRDQARGTMG